MIIKRLFLILFVLICLNCDEYSCEKTGNLTVWNYISKWFKKLDSQLGYLNKISAHLAWEMATEKTNDTLINRGLQISITKSNIRHQSCTRYVTIENTIEERIMYLLCRGPNFTTNQLIEISLLMDKLSQTYVQTKLCLDKGHWLHNLLKEEYGDTDQICLQGEQDFEKLIKMKNLSSEDLYWIWDTWHSVGKDIKPIYPILVDLMNQGAKANFYSDIGEVWREELEIPNLEEYVFSLYQQVQPLYEMLHAVVRYKLFLKYGPEVIDPVGLIPAHLFGNLWAQDWSSLLDLFFSLENDIDENISKKKWSVKNMVEIAEDFYVSLGLPRMTEKFWKYSKIDGTNSSMCHGSAANMFSNNDYRMLLCAELNMEDFYVIHHEMGHIEYYMAYKDLPTVFQDGANSAIQESIGDAIMTGVMVPHHLFRLGLIKEDRLYNDSLDIILLMRQALSKIPQISYGLMLDHYRWNIFNGKIGVDDYNSAFWSINKNIRGIQPPDNRDGAEYFDAGAKFHIADNTPYIRYYLASFIQVDIFKSMCQWSIYGKFTKTPLPFPLHRCDIYGSRTAGKQLKTLMSYGATRHWSKIYKLLTGRKHISIKPLIEYYKPVYKWLKDYIDKNNIPVGW